MSEEARIALGAILIALMLAVLVFGGGVLHYIESRQVKARDNFCPQGTWAQEREGIVIPGHTAVFVDTSNKISAQDGKKAFGYIEKWTRDLPFLQKISIYELPAGSGVKPKLSGKPWCVPKQGVSANFVYENPRLVEVAFKGEFLGRVRAIFNRLLAREEADQSPIIETLARLSEDGEVDSVWLISDMLQNSETASHYGGGRGDMAPLCKQLQFREVKIYYIDRGLRLQQGNSHREIWEKCFSAAKIEWR